MRDREPLFHALRVFQEERERPGFRLIAWTLQKNHIHLLVEVSSVESLSRSLQAIQVRLARGWNRAWGRRGRVFAGRFHSRLLKTSLDGRRALAYVLKNHLRHGLQIPCSVDPHGSALWMDVWLERKAWLEERKRFKVEGDPPPVVPPWTDALRFAVSPGSLSIYGRPRGYYRDEFAKAGKKVEKKHFGRQAILFS